eukprot:6485464-Amphidinium_carterae.1
MPATPPCDDNCDTKRASGNCPGSTRSKSIPSAWESSQPGDPRCVPHVPSVLDCSWLAAWILCPALFEQVSVSGKVDHLPLWQYHMTSNMKSGQHFATHTHGIFAIEP